MASLQGMIRAERQAIAERVAQVPQRQVQLAEYRSMIPTLGRHRSTARLARLLARACDREERSVRELESGKVARRFEERVIPFLHASDDGPTEQEATGRHLPGACKRPRVSHKPQTVGTWSEHATIDGSLAREFAAEFRGEAVVVPAQSQDQCRECGGQMLLLERKAAMCCASCGCSATHIDMTTRNASVRGDVEFVSQQYKRSNHFLEWLSMLQARENVQVPYKVLRAVMGVLVERGVRGSDGVNVHNVRDALKNLKMRAHYEHVCQITCRISGKPPPRLQGPIEEQLRLMFLAVQVPFEKEHVRGTRKNFLSYSYTLMQFFTLLWIDCTMVPDMPFTTLKGRDKLQKQNVIYHRICEELDWEYRPLDYNAIAAPS